jgi:hypothetical protein
MDPDSLSASILKSVYLVANLGNRSSQIWRAVIEGRDALKLGVIKRIGNGSTKISGKRTGQHSPYTSSTVVGIFNNRPSTLI